jgi:SAM-dependent methyltransferase
VVDKNLPPFARVPLRYLYYKWNTMVELDEEIIGDIQAYFNLDRKEVIWLMRSGGRLNSDFWKIMNPKTDQEKDEFYQLTPFYIFDLSWWHMTRFQRNFRGNVSSHAKGSLLDYGGGIGDFSAKFRKAGFFVDYADVEGRTFEFAKWLFARRGLEVGMINLSREQLAKSYDTIFCIDVIEHVPDAKSVLETLSRHLNPGGKLIITGLKINEESNIHPMHQKVNFDDDYPASLGLAATEFPWMLVKK